jgi:uncharacterized membrane protein HdeD (DUF308 family)
MDEPGLFETRETKLWFATVGRGVAALLFAMLAIGSPSPWMPIRRLAILFAVYAVADSGLTFFAAGRARRTHVVKTGRLLALEGGLSALVAIVAFAFPALTPLRILGGLRGMVIGTSDVLWSRRGNASDLIELAGVVAFVFGLLLLAWPGPGSIALPWLLGISTLVSGALLFAGALSQLRRGVELAPSV